MRERLLDGFQATSIDERNVALSNPQGYRLVLTAVPAGQRTAFRVQVFGPDRELPYNSFFPHDSSVTSATSNGSYDVASDVTRATLSAGDEQATLDWSTSPLLTIRNIKTGQILHEDLSARAYNLTGFGVRHYSRLNRKHIHLGLGEVAAPIDLSERRVEVRTSDSASYNAWKTDPLYKHTPFLITVPHEGGLCTGYYCTSHADSVWDVGCSIDEPWGAYKAFEAETGALEQYIFSGDLQQVVATLAELTGVLPVMPPRWALGYISSPHGLAAVDNPPLQTLTENFIDHLHEKGIPCSGLQFSSSYTVTQTEKGLARNVFTLNKHRMPDFPGFCKKAHSMGLRIIPNIKPYINVYHPAFAGLREGGGLFHDPDTKDFVKTHIWSMGIGEKLVGGWIDTSSKAGFEWWKNGASELIKMGIDGLWNDNDEYSLHDDAYEAAWEIPGLVKQDGKRKPVGLVGRTTFTELLGRSSFEALKENSPGRRPYILTRSANLNTMQYCCSTWSGDNRTDWETLKGNSAMTVSASLSLYHSHGSDVGGFAGPLPAPELFLRWCQLNAYQTRFCINSIHQNPSNPDQFSVNSPWMHEKLTPLIRDIIKRRYEILPYTYGLHHEGRIAKSPPVALLGWGPYQQDSKAWQQSMLDGEQFWLGWGRLMIAGIFQPGQTAREVYFPRASPDDRSVFFSLFAPYRCYSAGETATVQAPLDTLPVFARSGSVIPIGKPCATVTSTLGKTTNDGTSILIRPGLVELDDWRGIEIFPPRHGNERYIGEWIEDDGESTWPCPVARVQVTYFNDSDGTVTVEAVWREKDFVPYWSTLWVILPVGDDRAVATPKQTAQHRDGRRMYEINIR